MPDATVDQILRLARARADDESAPARRHRDADLDALKQRNCGAARRSVYRLRIWEEYLVATGRLRVKTYGDVAREFGDADAFSSSALDRLRSSIETSTEAGIGALKQSIQMDHAAACDGTMQPLESRYDTVRNSVRTAVEIGIAVLSAEADLRHPQLLQKVPSPTTHVPDAPDLDQSENGRQLRLRGFLDAHPGVTAADVWRGANVHSSDAYNWRKGKLATKSSMSQRIEAVLRGERRPKPASRQ